jgi:hypothetical protein
MNKGDLILRLETLPDDVEVKIKCVFQSSGPLAILGAHYDPTLKHVILQDHITNIKSREFVSHDGARYDIPWGGNIKGRSSK